SRRKQNTPWRTAGRRRPTECFVFSLLVLLVRLARPGSLQCHAVANRVGGLGVGPVSGKKTEEKEEKESGAFSHFTDLNRLPPLFSPRLPMWEALEQHSVEKLRRFKQPVLGTAEEDSG